MVLIMIFCMTRALCNVNVRYKCLKLSGPEPSPIYRKGVVTSDFKQQIFILKNVAVYIYSNLSKQFLNEKV